MELRFFKLIPVSILILTIYLLSFSNCCIYRSTPTPLTPQTPLSPPVTPPTPVSPPVSYDELNPDPTSTKFRVCEKTPEKFNVKSYNSKNPVKNSKQLIQSLRQYETHHCSKVLQATEFQNQTISSQNGFVRTVLDSYNNHHNLIIRPDDIWAAIMTQFSFYVNANAEEFRGKFVNFKGKKVLAVVLPGSLTTAPYNLFVTKITEKIHENLVDPEVKDWVLPNFSTTTENDRVTIGVVFMATMKEYFSYRMMLACGIPWITLEGTVEDWEEIYSRLAKLKSYKLERWFNMLEPILKQFVNAKKGKADINFWQRVCHYEGGGSGPVYLSGWITAFCAFNVHGYWQGQDIGEDKWLQIDTSDIPTGIVEVNVKIDDNGAEHDSVMFAGHMAMEVQADGMTLKPTLGWSISLKPSPEEIEEIEKEEDEKRKAWLIG